MKPMFISTTRRTAAKKSARSTAKPSSRKMAAKKARTPEQRTPATNLTVKGAKTGVQFNPADVIPALGRKRINDNQLMFSGAKAPGILERNPPVGPRRMHKLKGRMVFVETIYQFNSNPRWGIGVVDKDGRRVVINHGPGVGYGEREGVSPFERLSKPIVLTRESLSRDSYKPTGFFGAIGKRIRMYPIEFTEVRKGERAK